MKSVNFIIPYFGMLPNYTQLFLNSCKYNKDFNWTLITDDHTDYVFPDNVRVVYMSFSEVVDFVKSKFDFDVCFENPRKLCDMKPMYGYLFEEFNEGYDYWGFGDLDVILGDLADFITDEMLTYDKLFTLGHMTIMKNTDFMNTLFMKPVDGVEYYKKVLQTGKGMNFDEDFLDRVNINTICRKENVKLWEHAVIADIYTKSTWFQLDYGDEVEKKYKNYFIWNERNLIRRIKKNTGWENQKYMYIHLQKRKMDVCLLQDQMSIFKIIPNKFVKLDIPFEKIGVDDDKVKCKAFNMQYLTIRSKNLIAKIKERLNKRGVN